MGGSAARRPAPGGTAALTALINDLASTPLDRARPLWDVRIVDGVGRGSAVVTRMRHCIADGTANMLVARALFDAAPGAPPAPAAARAPKAAEPGLVERLVTPAIEVAERSHAQLRLAIDTAGDVVTHRRQAGKAAVALAAAGMPATELLPTPHLQSPLNGEFGLAKWVARSEPVAILDVKAVGAPLGAKVDDVLVAGMTGALRAYLSGSAASTSTGRPSVPWCRSTRARPSAPANSATSSTWCCSISPYGAGTCSPACACSRRAWTS